jgi:hypothetical protein
MQKIATLIIALGTLSLASIQASATTLTPQQVQNVCGGSMTTGGVSGATVSGCEKKCGGKTCTYNCCSGSKCPGGEGCSGTVVGMTAGGGKTKTNLPAATLREIKKMSLSPARKMPAAASKSQMLKSGAQQPPKTMKTAAPPSGGLLNQGGTAGVSGAKGVKQTGAKGAAGSKMPDTANPAMQRR